jgi:hypothetical protein
MEIQTTFDLNLAVQRWRENLAQSPAFGRENLNELESHLRDSVAAFQTRGLSAAEAFQIATRRIGQSHQLEPEFGKVNGGNIWLGRAIWMLIGIQVWPFFDRLMSGVGGNLFALGSRGVTHYPAGFARPIFGSVLIQLPAMIAAVWLTWAVLKRTDKFGGWIAAKLARRSSFVLCCIAACLLVFVSLAVLILLAVGQTNLSGGLATVSVVARSRQFIAPLRVVGFGILTLLLARKLRGLQKVAASQSSFDLNQAVRTWRENVANSRAFHGEHLNERELHLRGSVAALQTSGLSPEEGFLIATRRIGEGQQLEPEFDKINRDTLWPERAMWMLLGIQIWPLFDGLLSAVAGGLFAFGWRNVYHSASAFGDAWPVFFSALIQLPALIFAIWLSWKVLRKSSKLGQWMATKLPKRSSFVLCCVAVSVLALLLNALGMLLPAMWYKISGERIATVSYIDQSRAFVGLVRIIGFVILTLLLARKRLASKGASLVRR